MIFSVKMVANLFVLSVCFVSVINSGWTSPTKYRDIMDSSSSEDGIRYYFKMLTKNTKQYKRGSYILIFEIIFA